MSTTAAQKFAALAMPAAAVSLAIFTADPSWSPKREQYGSWRETMERAAAEKARKDAPPAQAPEPVAVPAPAAVPAPVAKKEPAPEPPKPGTPAPSAKKGPAPEPPKPALPQPEGIEFKVAGLPTCRSGAPIKTPAADRLDVTVAVSGAYKVGINFADPDTLKSAVETAPDAQKKGGLLFLVPNARAPWEAMGPVLNAGAGAGWTRIAIAVAHPDNAGLGRELLVRVPNGPVELPKGIDAMTVKVGVGPNPVFVLNGEECKDAATLEAKAKALHEECELMTEGYTGDVEKTPWTVDGTGAMVGGVVTALDALASAGVKTVRIAGVQKPSGEVKAPSGETKQEPEAPKPDEEKK